MNKLGLKAFRLSGLFRVNVAIPLLSSLTTSVPAIVISVLCDLEHHCHLTEFRLSSKKGTPGYFRHLDDAIDMIAYRWSIQATFHASEDYFQ